MLLHLAPCQVLVHQKNAVTQTENSFKRLLFNSLKSNWRITLKIRKVNKYVITNVQEMSKKGKRQELITLATQTEKSIAESLSEWPQLRIWWTRWRLRKIPLLKLLKPPTMLTTTPDSSDTNESKNNRPFYQWFPFR